MATLPTLAELGRALADGRESSRSLVEGALGRIADPAGEGARAFTRVYAEAARAQAEASDRLRGLGLVPSPLAGIPISIKDLFDVQGDVTQAGSVTCAGEAPATADAAAVTRLRAAGAVVVGKTNMVEFAYGGVGLNPHFGTPRAPFDRHNPSVPGGRAPGGSSSGAAVSVADAMAAAALGTDTGGSCRIPAALCGITGFKPTQERVPLDGAFPLSPSLDSIGSLAPTAACCALVDRILAGKPAIVPPARPLGSVRLAIPQTLVLDDLDQAVSASWRRTLTALSRAGAQIVELPLREFAAIGDPRVRHAIAAAEAWAIHRPRLRDPAISRLYDPRVSARIAHGAELDVADYIDLLAFRRDLRRRVAATAAGFDALIMPTCPITAPTIAEASEDDAYPRINILLLRNTSVTNFLDGTAISLPCTAPDEPPAGLMIAGERGADDRILAIAQAAEAALKIGI